MTNPYRPILFSRETVCGVIGAVMLVAGIAGFFLAPWLAPIFLVWR